MTKLAAKIHVRQKFITKSFLFTSLSFFDRLTFIFITFPEMALLCGDFSFMNWSAVHTQLICRNDSRLYTTIEGYLGQWHRSTTFLWKLPQLFLTFSFLFRRTFLLLTQLTASMRIPVRVGREKPSSERRDGPVKLAIANEHHKKAYH